MQINGGKEKMENQNENKSNGNKFSESQPLFGRNITRSKDGKWLIIKTIRTDIIHVNYFRKILGDSQ